jgi:hypothetical protein
MEASRAAAGHRALSILVEGATGQGCADGPVDVDFRVCAAGRYEAILYLRQSSYVERAGFLSNTAGSPCGAGSRCAQCPG